MPEQSRSNGPAAFRTSTSSTGRVHRSRTTKSAWTTLVRDRRWHSRRYEQMSADGYVTSTLSVGDELTGEIVLTLSRGYRVIRRVELPATVGPQLVRVVGDANESMDSFLDSESDRRFEPPGRLSLGPLAPGAYVIELHGAGGRTERIRIVDRDVSATFR
jgi:hypothetical protein